MRKSWRLSALLLLLSVFLIGGLAGGRVLALGDDLRGSLRAYSDVLTAAKAAYGAETTYRDLVWASIQGMLRRLDPHTNFLTPEGLSTMRERQQASFFGLGIVVGKREGRLTVISPIEGGPAARLGVRAGDVIDTIEGEEAEPLSLDDAVQKLKGPKGTQVSITLLRRGVDEPIPITATRAEIPQTTVRYAYLLDEQTGYVLISDFARATGAELDRALRSLRERGMKRLILDLRNNGGGLLDQAIDVADQFLAKGATIVETRGRAGDSHQSYSAQGNHASFGLPLVILVNHGTASASEIVSGAVQDHDVGVIVGQPTWGKGLVQTVYNLSYGAGLALTTAKYYTPSGRLIQRDYTSFFDYYYDDPETAAAAPPAAGEEFKTELGRTVFGGGGITPDVVAKPLDVPEYAQYLYSRNAFFDFAVDYLRDHPKPSPDWRPGEQILPELAAWIRTDNPATEADLEAGFKDPATRSLAVREAVAEIMNAAHGLEAGHRVRTAADPQVNAALAEFGRASALLSERATHLRIADKN
jgi:carboxyl-terminal processing protease